MVKKGERYTHYKHDDKFYEIISLGKMEATLEDVVVYKPLYETEFGDDFVWVRSLKEFSGTVQVDGVTRPRFKRVEE